MSRSSLPTPQIIGRHALDAPEVSVYHVRDGKVVQSQMFHADSSAVAQFLTDAQSAAAAAIEEPS